MHECLLAEHLFQELGIHGLLRGVLSEGHLEPKAIGFMFLFGTFTFLPSKALLVGGKLKCLTHTKFCHFFFGLAQLLELGEHDREDVLVGG